MLDYFDVFVYKENEGKKRKVNATPLPKRKAMSFCRELEEGAEEGVVFEDFFLSNFKVEVQPNFDEVLEYNLLYKVPSRSRHRTYDSEWVGAEELPELKRIYDKMSKDPEVTDLRIVQRTTRYDVLHQDFLKESKTEDGDSEDEGGGRIVAFPQKRSAEASSTPKIFAAISAIWGADFDKILFEDDKEEMKKLNRAVEKENLLHQTRLMEKDEKTTGHREGE